MAIPADPKADLKNRCDRWAERYLADDDPHPQKEADMDREARSIEEDAKKWNIPLEDVEPDVIKRKLLRISSGHHMERQRQGLTGQTN